MIKIERDLRALGGIARRSELLGFDHPRDLIDIMLMYKSFITVRHGWYAAPDMPVHVSISRNASRLTPVADTILHWDDERSFQERWTSGVPAVRATDNL